MPFLASHAEHTGRGENANVFRAYFDEKQNCDDPYRLPHRRKRNIQSGFDEIKRRENGKCNALHPVHQSFVADKHARHH